MSQYLSAWSNARGFMPSSFCDWPGKISAVLFLGGCNLRCPTCHNAGLAWRPERTPALDREAVMRHLRSRRKWLDGLVVTGGEPSISNGLPAFLRELKELGLPIKLDTNGMRPDVVLDLIKASLVDVFAVDFKGPFAKYPELSGNCVTEDQARDNLGRIFEMAAKWPRKFYFRTTQVPIVTDEDIAALRLGLPEGFDLIIQKFVPPGRKNAQADSQKGRLPGNLVSGQDSQRHIQGIKGQRRKGSPSRQTARVQG